MVDCRPAGAPPHELASDALHNQQAASGDMAPPAAARASTPATNVTTFAPNYINNGAMPAATAPAGYGCAPYACGVKSVVWCGSPALPAPHAPPPPPPPVNPHVHKSVQPSGADLPMNDIATLRFYFNLGVECMWAAYGPPPPAPPPRHYSPRDLAQDMQQVSLQDRDGHKHKQDKPPLAQPKPPQRPLLGPRFKRGGNQDGNQNNSHNQNKGHNNNMANKGPNNRRNSHSEARLPHGYPAADECVEPPLVTFPYIPYPPPIYPVPYYPVDSDPAMMGMMGGMGYVGYEEGVEYAPVQHYYPPPYPHHPHHEHK